MKVVLVGALVSTMTVFGVTGALPVRHRGPWGRIDQPPASCSSVTPDIRRSWRSLGVVRTARGTTQTLRVLPGDLLVLGSDGLAEREDPTRVMFGYDRLENVCTTYGTDGAANLGRHLLDAITSHADGTAQSDDCTLVILGPTATIH